MPKSHFQRSYSFMLRDKIITNKQQWNHQMICQLTILMLQLRLKSFGNLVIVLLVKELKVEVTSLYDALDDMENKAILLANNCLADTDDKAEKGILSSIIQFILGRHMKPSEEKTIFVDSQGYRRFKNLQKSEDLKLRNIFENIESELISMDTEEKGPLVSFNITMDKDKRTAMLLGNIGKSVDFSPVTEKANEIYNKYKLARNEAAIADDLAVKVVRSRGLLSKEGLNTAKNVVHSFQIAKQTIRDTNKILDEAEQTVEVVDKPLSMYISIKEKIEGMNRLHSQEFRMLLSGIIAGAIVGYSIGYLKKKHKSKTKSH